MAEGKIIRPPIEYWSKRISPVDALKAFAFALDSKKLHEVWSHAADISVEVSILKVYVDPVVRVQELHADDMEFISSSFAELKNVVESDGSSAELLVQVDSGLLYSLAFYSCIARLRNTIPTFERYEKFAAPLLKMAPTSRQNWFQNIKQEYLDEKSLRCHAQSFFGGVEEATNNLLLLPSKLGTD